MKLIGSAFYIIIEKDIIKGCTFKFMKSCVQTYLYTTNMLKTKNTNPENYYKGFSRLV